MALKKKTLTPVEPQQQTHGVSGETLRSWLTLLTEAIQFYDDGVPQFARPRLMRLRTAMQTALCVLAILALAGCTATRIKGGRVGATLHNGSVIEQRQSADPKDRTDLNTDYERVTELVLPSGSTFQLESNRSVTVSAPTVLHTTEKESVKSTLGAAQKNVIGETIAKLASLRWLTWLGAAVFLFGVASAVYPPLKVIVGGSVTTSATIAAAGLAMVFLPVIVVGHEGLILAGCAGAAGIYFFAHRHGALKGELTALKQIVTPTKPDAGQPPPAAT